MTKLVAGYVLGRVTSPHQFVFVFVKGFAFCAHNAHQDGCNVVEKVATSCMLKCPPLLPLMKATNLIGGNCSKLEGIWLHPTL
jgi:hypothetical protein